MSKTYLSKTNPLTIMTTTRICTWISVQEPLLRSITSAKPGLCSARGTTEMKYLREGCKREVSFLGWKMLRRKYQFTTDEKDQTVSLWLTDYFTHYSFYQTFFLSSELYNWLKRDWDEQKGFLTSELSADRPPAHLGNPKSRKCFEHFILLQI